MGHHPFEEQTCHTGPARGERGAGKTQGAVNRLKREGVQHMASVQGPSGVTGADGGPHTVCT